MLVKKFGQKEVTTKDFYRQRQITDIFTIDVKKVVVSDNVSCNNGKDCRYFVGYQVDVALIPLFIKTSKNIFSHGVSQYDKKGEGKYVHGKLKMWKEHIKTNFHGQDVPYEMYCNATIVSKIDSVYKQGKNYHPQVYIGECKYTDAENRQYNILNNDDDNDDDDDGFFEV